MKKLLIILFLFTGTLVCAQRWHFQYGFKIGAGKNFFSGIEKFEDGFQYNYQLGLTGRITKKALIMDFGILFQYSPYFNSDFYGHTRINTTGLNVPFTTGIIIINKPLFKWNIQAGVQNSFIFKREVGKNSSEQLLYNPYQLSGLISTGIEVGWFILDVNYQPAITKMFKNQDLGFNQAVNLTIGLIF